MRNLFFCFLLLPTLSLAATSSLIYRLNPPLVLPGETSALKDGGFFVAYFPKKDEALCVGLAFGKAFSQPRPSEDCDFVNTWSLVPDGDFADMAYKRRVLRGYSFVMISKDGSYACAELNENNHPIVSKESCDIDAAREKFEDERALRRRQRRFRHRHVKLEQPSTVIE